MDARTRLPHQEAVGDSFYSAASVLLLVLQPRTSALATHVCAHRTRLRAATHSCARHAHLHASPASVRVTRVYSFHMRQRALPKGPVWSHFCSLHANARPSFFSGCSAVCHFQRLLCCPSFFSGCSSDACCRVLAVVGEAPGPPEAAPLRLLATTWCAVLRFGMAFPLSLARSPKVLVS
jgi:hypothetical protein